MKRLLLAIACLLPLAAHAQSVYPYTNRAGNGPAAAGDPPKLSERQAADRMKCDVSASACQVTPGSGTKQQALSAILGRTLNILDYGATMACGAGSDDTPAWGAALAAASLLSGGAGVIDVPQGCTTLDTITISAAGIRVRGQGSGITTIKPKTLTSTPIVVNATHIRISDLAFTSASQQSGGSFLQVNAGEDVELDHFVMSGGYLPILGQNGDDIRISRGHIYNTSGPAIIKITGGNDYYIDHLVADNPPTAQPTNGLWVTNAGGIWLDDLDFIHSGHVFSFAPEAANQEISWIFASQIAADTSSGCGIRIDAVANSQVRSVNFHNSWTATNALDGVCVGRFNNAGTVDGVSLVQHRSYNNQQRGVLFAMGTNLSVDGGSQISGNSTASNSVGVYSGVEVGVGVSGWSVRNSKVGAGYGFTQAQGNSISVDAGGSDQYQITTNDLTGFGSGSVPIADNGTGTNKVISGNLGALGNLSVTMGASPAAYTAAQQEQVFIGGPNITAVTLQHQGKVILMTASNQSVTMAAGDVLRVSYSGSTAPTLDVVLQ